MMDDPAPNPAAPATSEPSSTAPPLFKFKVLDLTPWLNVKSTLSYLMDEIAQRKLHKFYDLTDPEVVAQLEQTVKKLADLPTKLDINVDTARELAVLSLYDLCILIDDSFSMKFYRSDRRLDWLRQALKSLLNTYAALCSTERMVAIRYVNQADHDRKARKRLPKGILIPVDNNYNDITMELSIRVDALVNRIPFDGRHSQIGLALERYVLEDHVYFGTRPAAPGKLRNIGKMKKPLLIFIITDSEMDLEDEKKRSEVIERVMKAASLNTHIQCKRAVSYQYLQLGSDQSGRQKFQSLLRDMGYYSKRKAGHS